MSSIQKLIQKLKSVKNTARKVSPLAVLAISIPVAISMTACQGNVSLETKQKEEALASIEKTRGGEIVVFPDAPPSVADGGVYWQQNNCASCHGADGKGVAGQCDVDLTNAELMRSRKPIDQYKLISYGAATFHEAVTSSHVMEGANPDGDPAKMRDAKHPDFVSKLNKRQRWDLVFYARSLAVPLLSFDERLKMKAVFGANCAVCHGSRGAGDGNLNKGLVLQPNPANFNQFDRFYDRTDEQIWDHIANGIKWEGMPNFIGKEDRGNKVKFDADYIWKLVQYVRNFHEDGEYALEDPNKNKAGRNPGSGNVSLNNAQDAEIGLSSKQDRKGLIQ